MNKSRIAIFSSSLTVDYQADALIHGICGLSHQYEIYIDRLNHPIFKDYSYEKLIKSHGLGFSLYRRLDSKGILEIDHNTFSYVLLLPRMVLNIVVIPQIPF